MWAKVIAKDLTNEDVLKKETLRAKWEANPITDVDQTNVFLKYVLSVLETDKQEGIEVLTDAFAAAATAETQEDTNAAFQRVGEEHRDKVINFMVSSDIRGSYTSAMTRRLSFYVTV